MRAIPPLARRHGKPRTAIPVPRPAIRMPDVAPWKAPAFSVVPPDPATWPFGANGHPMRGEPPNGRWIMYVLDTGTGELRVRTTAGSWPLGPDCSSGHGGYASRSGVCVHGHAWVPTPGQIGFPRHLAERGTEM